MARTKATVGKTIASLNASWSPKHGKQRKHLYSTKGHNARKKVHKDFLATLYFGTTLCIPQNPYSSLAEDVNKEIINFATKLRAEIINFKV
jgi:hypothetical protein